MTDGTVTTELPLRANDFVERELDDRIARIEEIAKANVLCFNGMLMPPFDDIIRDKIEKRVDLGTNREKLVVILTTPGGYVEPVQRIVETIRHHYEVVDFIVPNHAYSAGTILAMSGDAIKMDYYARLGPIDPQTPGPGNRYLPAQGYLRQYEKLVQRAEAGEITTAEVQVMLSFDQAELYMHDQAVEQSVALLKEWLVEYKFRNWTQTRTSKEVVTPERKAQRAEEIARKLNDTDKWHSHGHGISREVLERDVNLQIDDLAKEEDLYKAVKQYDRLLADYMLRMGAFVAIHMAETSLEMI